MKGLKAVLAPVLVVLTLVVIIVVIVISRAQQQQMVTVVEGNTEQKVLEIRLGHYQDTQCGMPVEHLKDSAQLSMPDGKTWFFDDVGCLVNWISGKPVTEQARMWVYTRDTGRWIEAASAWYSLTDTTPMQYGFGAYETQQQGFVDFETVKLRMLRGENLTDPYVRRELLGNH